MNPRSHFCLRIWLAIDVVHCGISNTADIIYLPAKRALSPRRSISAITKREGSQVAVEIMTLDDVIRSRGFTPDIVKIDVEGWEVNVLNGATKTIHVFKPILIIEVHPRQMRNIGHNQEMVSLFLRDHGYLIYAFDDHRTKGFSPLIEVCKLTKTFNNDIVCIHKDDVRLFSLTSTRLAAPKTQQQ